LCRGEWHSPVSAAGWCYRGFKSHPLRSNPFKLVVSN